jgi:transposase
MKTKELTFIRNFKRYAAKHETINAMAKQCGVSRGTIHKWIRKHYPYYRHNKQRRRETMQLLDNGFSIEQITEMTGQTRTSVIRIIREENKINISLYYDATIKGFLLQKKHIGQS